MRYNVWNINYSLVGFSHTLYHFTIDIACILYRLLLKRFLLSCCHVNVLGKRRVCKFNRHVFSLNQTDLYSFINKDNKLGKTIRSVRLSLTMFYLTTYCMCFNVGTGTSVAVVVFGVLLDEIEKIWGNVRYIVLQSPKQRV